MATRIVDPTVKVFVAANNKLSVVLEPAVDKSDWEFDSPMSNEVFNRDFPRLAGKLLLEGASVDKMQSELNAYVYSWRGRLTVRVCTCGDN